MAQTKKQILALSFGVMLLAVCGSVDAQQTGKIFRIGFLDVSTASGSAVLLDAFRQELSKLGWIEGKNIAIEYRFAESKGAERLKELAVELVRLKVDLIVASSPTSASAAKKATTTVPVVMVAVGDPVGFGLVASLARPEGNVTGNSSLVPELNSKRLEILKDAVPKLDRVGFLTAAGASDLQLTKRAQACGSGTEAKIGSDQDRSHRQRIRERVSHCKAEAGGCDYDRHWSSVFF